MNILQHRGVNFALTNRIPRRRLSTLMGRFSRIENRFVCAVSLRVWSFFSGLDLSDASQQRFASMHQCFTRELKPGSRPADTDPDILCSPCDGIVGACGTVEDGQVLQVKGSPYALQDLLRGGASVEAFRGGTYATLRLTSAMYHRFHAPHDCRVVSVTHVPGDAWNVNAPALERVPGLYCRNERAVIATVLDVANRTVVLVPVAAILVSGIRLRFLTMSSECRGPAVQSYRCDASLLKGQEMGWFEHGSTIIVLAPQGFSLADGIQSGATIRAGEALMRLPRT